MMMSTVYSAAPITGRRYRIAVLRGFIGTLRTNPARIA
jgi:hypothetical protein